MNKNISLLHVLDPVEVEKRIARGADVNAEDANGYSALHGACFCGKVKIVELLIKNGAFLDVKDVDGVTPLMCASEKGHVMTTLLLVQNGASVTTVNFFGGTALSRACKCGHQNVVSILVEQLYILERLIPMEEYRHLHNDEVDYKFVRFKPPMRSEPFLWVLFKNDIPDFSHIYASVQPDDDSSCFLTQKFDGTRWYTAIIEGAIVEKVQE